MRFFYLNPIFQLPLNIIVLGVLIFSMKRKYPIQQLQRYMLLYIQSNYNKSMIHVIDEKNYTLSFNLIRYIITCIIIIIVLNILFFNRAKRLGARYDS